MDINGNHKGILVLCLILVTIIYFSKDLEGILLLTGILVNILAISGSTGLNKFIKSNNTPDREVFKDVGCVKEKEKEKKPKTPFVKDSHQSKKYKGSIDWVEDDNYIQTSEDITTNKSINRPGVNYKRQISGSMKRKSMIQPYICSELIDEEHKHWWSQKDL